MGTSAKLASIGSEQWRDGAAYASGSHTINSPYGSRAVLSKRAEYAECASTFRRFPKSRHSANCARLRRVDCNARTTTAAGTA